jgi:hypothetical protein
MLEEEQRLEQWAKRVWSYGDPELPPTSSTIDEIAEGEPSHGFWGFELVTTYSRKEILGSLVRF